MVNSGRFSMLLLLPTDDLANGVRRDISQQLSTSGRAPLVINHGKAFTLLCQAQHGLGKISAACRINPAGSENQVPAAMDCNQLLTFELGLAIDVERRRYVGFQPRLAAAAVKHLVGGVMHQPSAELIRFLSQYAGGQGIDGAG